ncbi:hypothetical protein DL93DRAFT_604208 [Clavulina sp. PMI_390]|nr:hypothetical protein DL93DRAFT_604208 [Clavulina sp. PMI_390]
MSMSMLSWEKCLEPLHSLLDSLFLACVNLLRCTSCIATTVSYAPCILRISLHAMIGIAIRHRRHPRSLSIQQFHRPRISTIRRYD